MHNNDNAQAIDPNWDWVRPLHDRLLFLESVGADRVAIDELAELVECLEADWSARVAEAKAAWRESINGRIADLETA